MLLPNGTYYSPPKQSTLKSKKYLFVFNYDLIIKVKEVTLPYSGDTKFLRVVAAIPNLAGRTMSGYEIPSFRRPYLVWESSDYTLEEPPTAKHMEALVRRFKRQYPRVGII